MLGELNENRVYSLILKASDILYPNMLHINT